PRDGVDSPPPAEQAGLDPRHADGHVERRARRRARNAALGPATVLMVVTLTSGGFMTFLPIARPDGALASVALLVRGTIGGLSRWRVGLIAGRVGLAWLLPAWSARNRVGVSTVAAGLLLQGASSWAVGVIGCAVRGAGYGAVQNLTLVAACQEARHQQLVRVGSVWKSGFDTGL